MVPTVTSVMLRMLAYHIPGQSVIAARRESCPITRNVATVDSQCASSQTSLPDQADHQATVSERSMMHHHRCALLQTNWHYRPLPDQYRTRSILRPAAVGRFCLRHAVDASLKPGACVVPLHL